MALISYTGKNVLGTGILGGEFIKLLPGVNEIDDDKLILMKENPQFQSRMKSGAILILFDVKDKDGKRPVTNMLEEIPRIFDTKLLKKIIQSDGRDAVVHAAREQLDLIKNPAKAKAEAENEHFG